MRQVTRKGLITMAAAGGVLALGGGYAHADSGAASSATNSPGVLSGNSVQIPVEIPVNVCGNSVDVVGLLNPSFGNDCENGTQEAAAPDTGYDHASSGTSRPGRGSTAGDTTARHDGEGTGRHRGGAGGATAESVTAGSPGILSGNSVQAPISVPVNVCGNSVDVIGLLNPTFGNECANDVEVTPPTEVPEKPPVTPEEPPVLPPANEPTEPNAPEPHEAPGEQLAQTGAGGLDLLIPAGAGLMLAGAGTVLYRRSRSAA
ncbi:chaplin [uncultured Streptomyces sp.]|uniref:chaplin n=1 Tax=uncultured Streptomyces sp. TaxID=174707 RepID=UPI00261E24A8|nr:chaplin [uncultured Streptomyces sp.]